MTIDQLSELINEVLSETIRKVDGEYVVYPKKGGKRLGTHPSKEKALAQLRAIEANRTKKEGLGRENVAPNHNNRSSPHGSGFKKVNELEDYEIRYWALHADLFDILKKIPHKYAELSAKLDGDRRKALDYFYSTYFANQQAVAEGPHDPMNPGILKKRLGKLSCSKVRAERGKLKDKGTTYAKALQRYLNYHCQ
jgi:hypothetical protein